MRAKCWKVLPEKRVACELCRHGCVLAPQKRGLCGVRMNAGGELHTLLPDVVSSVQMDPMEKKPLYHFLPGTQTFSIGSVGCNFACDFCQNYAISRLPADTGRIAGRRVKPEFLVEEASRRGAASLAFTYNEPTVFFELVHATTGLAQSAGLPCVLVTNGYAGEACLELLHNRIVAANVDLKSFQDKFYRTHCKAHLAPVLDGLKFMRRNGWWLEVTTLIIPGCNDSDGELQDIARFIRDELGPEVPWHVSRFHGAYRMREHPSTPQATMTRAWELGRAEGLRFVYVGNMGGGMGTSTFCPHCSAICISRNGFRTEVSAVGGRCPSCGEMLPGIWERP